MRTELEAINIATRRAAQICAQLQFLADHFEAHDQDRAAAVQLLEEAGAELRAALADIERHRRSRRDERIPNEPFFTT